MKKLILIISLLIFYNILSASEEVRIKPEITNVKVFLRGAEITHTAKVKLEKGLSNLIFTEISHNIDQNSINVSAKGDLIILSVTQRINYIKSPTITEQLKILEDSLITLNKKISLNQNEIDVLKAEIELLSANKNISNDKGVTITELQKFSEFYRKRLREIKNKISELTYINNNLEKTVERISKQINELNNSINRPLNELIVSVNTKNKCEAEFKISYITYEASWQPSYDFRVENINSPANLIYKANIRQNSGIDWNNVDIILSTRNIIQSNIKPQLEPWYIDFERTFLRKESSQKFLLPQIAEEKSESLLDYFETNQTQLAIEFIPKIKYSILSNNKLHNIEIKNVTLPIKYEYYCAPKLDNNAFLISYLSNWNDYNLLPGEANIYFENTAIGKTFINPFVSDDSLIISLGRDPNINIEKKAIKDFTTNKFLSNDIERTFAFEIKVKNNKSIPINLIIEDQIPISKNEEIKIKLINYDNGIYFEKDGKIRWNIRLDAGESLIKKLIYSIRYPKDKRISNL